MHSSKAETFPTPILPTASSCHSFELSNVLITFDQLPFLSICLKKIPGLKKE